MAVLINLLVTFLVSAFVIWIVSKLGLGLAVDSFGSAFLAAIIIAIVSAVVYWLLGKLGISMGSGLIGALVNLLVAAIILMISGSFLSGFKVEGFTGAVIAAIAIAVVSWLLNWVLVKLGIAPLA